MHLMFGFLGHISLSPSSAVSHIGLFGDPRGVVYDRAAVGLNPADIECLVGHVNALSTGCKVTVNGDHASLHPLTKIKDP